MHVVGPSRESLKPFTDRVNAAEGLPKAPLMGPPGQFIRVAWTPSAEEPDPPPGWTVRHYGDPVELVDGRFAIPNVEAHHLIHLDGLALDQVEQISPKLSGSGSELG